MEIKVKLTVVCAFTLLVTTLIGCRSPEGSPEEDAARRRERNDPLKSMVTVPIERANSVATAEAERMALDEYDEE